MDQLTDVHERNQTQTKFVINQLVHIRQKAKIAPEADCSQYCKGKRQAINKTK